MLLECIPEESLLRTSWQYWKLKLYTSYGLTTPLCSIHLQKTLDQIHRDYLYKNVSGKTFLAVQWLSLCSSTAGGVGLAPGREVLHAAGYGNKKNVSGRII